jgi:hypothetical protein
LYQYSLFPIVLSCPIDQSIDVTSVFLLQYNLKFFPSKIALVILAVSLR